MTAGTLVLVVGPSGAGKDTLIAAARERLVDDARYVFPRRVVTRTAMSELEDHESISDAAFEARHAAGGFALSWEAHGLRYGLPASLREALDGGRIVVVNGSRATIATARQLFPRLAIVLIDAAPEIRATRLARRGRETVAEIARRLARDVEMPLADARRVDNSGTPEAGRDGFLAALASIAAD